MTELFKYTSKEEAIKEIDRRLMEAMQPPQSTGLLLSKMKESIRTRRASSPTTKPAV